MCDFGDEAARSAQNFSLFLSLFLYMCMSVYVFKRSLSLSLNSLRDPSLSAGGKRF